MRKLAGPVFTANYPGDCKDCGESFDAGDDIRYDPDDEIVGQECCGYVYDED